MIEACFWDALGRYSLCYALARMFRLNLQLENNKMHVDYRMFQFNKLSKMSSNVKCKAKNSSRLKKRKEFWDMAQLVKRKRDRPSSIPGSYGKLEVSVLLSVEETLLYR